MRDELERVRRARRRLDAAELEYRQAVAEAKAAGIPHGTIATYAQVSRQAIQKQPTEGATTA